MQKLFIQNNRKLFSGIIISVFLIVFSCNRLNENQKTRKNINVSLNKNMLRNEMNKYIKQNIPIGSEPLGYIMFEDFTQENLNFYIGYDCNHKLIFSPDFTILDTMRYSSKLTFILCVRNFNVFSEDTLFVKKIRNQYKVLTLINLDQPNAWKIKMNKEMHVVNYDSSYSSVYHIRALREDEVR